MQNFQIFDDEHPAPVIEQSHYAYSEGNWRYTRNGNIDVLAFEDLGESITVHVAAARRYGSIDAIADDQPFSIFSGVYA